MAQYVDLTRYFTRTQGDARYTHQSVPPPMPAVSVSSTGLEGGDDLGWVDLQVLASPGITGLAIATIEITYSYGAVTHHTLYSISGGHIYRVHNLPAGGVVTFQARSTDTSNQSSPSSPGLTTTVHTDSHAPLAPAIIGSVVGGAAQIVIAVGNSEPDFSHYELYRSDGGAYVLVMSFALLTITDYAIPLTASYTYKVRAVDYSGNYGESTATGALALTTAAMVTPDALDLSTAWIGVNGAGHIVLQFPPSLDPYLASYNIYRRIYGGSSWVLVGSPTAISGTPDPFVWTDSSDTLGVTYDYTVTVVNRDADESAQSTPFLTYESGSLSTDPVSGVTITGQPGGIMVTWRPSASMVYYYLLNWRIAPGDWQTDSIAILGNSAPLYGFTQTRLELANQLMVRITAVGNVLSPSVTDTATYTDLQGYYPTSGVPPLAPASLTATSNPDGSLTLAWPASTSTSATGYLIEQTDSLAGGIWQQVGTLNSFSPTNSYLVGGLEPYTYRSRTYQFRVYTLDLYGGISATAASVSGVQMATGTGPTAYTTALTATGVLGGITLVWNNPTGDIDYVGSTFAVYRKVTDLGGQAPNSATGFAVDATYHKILEIPGRSDGTLITITDNEPDELYRVTCHYRLKARDRFGNPTNLDAAGYVSADVSAVSQNLNDKNVPVPDGVAPTEPVLVSAAANSDGTTTIVWKEADTSTRYDLASYTVWRSAGDNTHYQALLRLGAASSHTLPLPSVTWIDPAPPSGVDTYYSVSATDTQNESSSYDATGVHATAYNTTVPLPVPAGSFVATGGPGKIYLSWDVSPDLGLVLYRITVPAVTDVVAGKTMQTASTTITLELPMGPNADDVSSLALSIQVLRWGTTTVLSSATAISSIDTTAYIPQDNQAPDIPGKPRIIYMEPTNGLAMISWNASPSADVLAYYLDLYTADLNDHYAAGSALPNQRGCWLRGLTADINYYMGVSAVDSLGHVSSRNSDWVLLPSSHTTPTPGTLTISSTSTGLSTDETTAWITVNWGASTDTDFGRYEVQYGGTVYEPRNDKTQTSYTITGLALSYVGTVQVRTVSQYGVVGTWSTGVGVTTPAAPANPYAPYITMTGSSRVGTTYSFTINFFAADHVSAYTAPNFYYMRVYVRSLGAYLHGSYSYWYAVTPCAFTFTLPTWTYPPTENWSVTAYAISTTGSSIGTSNNLYFHIA